MTTLVLFHSALGLRPSVSRFADELRHRGHTVHTPDLFDGEVFDDLERGAAKRDALGIPTLMARATAAVEGLSTDVVYAGLSMGTAAAQLLALSRPGARGAVLLHGALPLSLFGATRWPAGVPVQLHVSPDDPWVDADGVAAFEDSIPRGLLERREHPGTGHLFTDEDGPDHDEAASARLRADVARFLRDRSDESLSATAQGPSRPDRKEGARR